MDTTGILTLTATLGLAACLVALHSIGIVPVLRRIAITFSALADAIEIGKTRYSESQQKRTAELEAR